MLLLLYYYLGFGILLLAALFVGHFVGQQERSEESMELQDAIVPNKQHEQHNPQNNISMESFRSTWPLTYKILSLLFRFTLLMFLLHFTLVSYGDGGGWLWHAVGHVSFVYVMTWSLFANHTRRREKRQELPDDSDETKPRQPLRRFYWDEAILAVLVGLLLIETNLTCLYRRTKAIEKLKQQESSWYNEDYDYFGKARIASWVPNEEYNDGYTTVVTLEWDCPETQGTCQYTIERATCSFPSWKDTNYRHMFYHSYPEDYFVYMQVYNVDENTCGYIMADGQEDDGGGDDDDDNAAGNDKQDKTAAYRDAYVNVLGSCTSCEAVPLVREMTNQLLTLQNYARQAPAFGVAALLTFAVAAALFWEHVQQQQQQQQQQPAIAANLDGQDETSTANFELLQADKSHQRNIV